MMNASRILVVDDARDDAALLCRHLERHGYAVATVVDSAGALRLLAREPVDLVLLDIAMAGLDGMETLRLLRARHQATALPVIIVTARDDRREIVAALRAGANDYVVKPIDPEIMLARVERQLTFRRENAQLVDSLEAARSATAAERDLVATMSHELRTPLTAIIGFADLIAGAAGVHEPQRCPGWGANIRRAGTHILDLVDNVVEIARPGSGESGAAHIENVDIAETCRTVLDLVSPLAATNRNRLALFLPDEAGSIVTDALKLRQCLINLLGNSCKFTRGGSIEFHVEIRADAAGEQLAFTVADTGIGIAEAEMRSLFVRFAQANERIARDYGGSELGLALSAELAALLGGRILAESVAGEGSRFTLLLPRWNGADAPLRSLANA